MSQPEFTVEIFQNEYLPAGSREVSAIVTVTSSGPPAGTPGPGSEAAEIIIIDRSGSMSTPMTKMIEARHATAAAVNAIRDGVAFAVVAGAQRAEPVYPADGSLARASERTRQAAIQAINALHPSGGTAIGQWLRLANQIFGSRPAALRHAILLTDGKNQHESAEQLDEAIRLCTGVFSCDCRGVGTDWEVRELRTISTALLGTVDIVPEPAGLAADFAAMMASSMSKGVPDIALRVWTPQHATVRFVKQVAPTVDDSTGRRVTAGQQAGDYPTGAWGAESRDYHICVDVEPAAWWQVPHPGHRSWGKGWSRLSGPTMRRCRRGSTPRSRTTPARPSLPRSSSKGWRHGRPATPTPRPPSSAGRSHWRTNRATTQQRSCLPRSWTSSTRRPARSGSRRGSTTRTRWRSTPAPPRQCGSRRTLSLNLVT
jgi:hypothetical protein